MCSAWSDGRRPDGEAASDSVQDGGAENGTRGTGSQAAERRGLFGKGRRDAFGATLGNKGRAATRGAIFHRAYVEKGVRV